MCFECDTSSTHSKERRNKKEGKEIDEPVSIRVIKVIIVEQIW